MGRRPAGGAVAAAGLHGRGDVGELVWACSGPPRLAEARAGLGRRLRAALAAVGRSTP
jgi:hypothetical protein